MVPLASWANSFPINSSFLPGRPTSSHNRRAGWQILPRIARHTIENGFLAVNHLIVRQRQNKVFGMVVQHTKGQLVVMILAVHRVQLHVVQRVVHPAQIPLVPEPRAARFRWTRHASEVCRLFRHADCAGHLLANNAVGIAQKLNGFGFSRPPNSFGIHSPSLRL